MISVVRDSGIACSLAQHFRIQRKYVFLLQYNGNTITHGTQTHQQTIYTLTLPPYLKLVMQNNIVWFQMKEHV